MINMVTEAVCAALTAEFGDAYTVRSEKDEQEPKSRDPAVYWQKIFL